MAAIAQSNGRRLQLFPDESEGRQGLTHQTLDFVISYDGKRPESDILGSASTSAFVPVLSSGTSTSPNRYYFGENGDALRLLLNDPNTSGKVTLIYIDPPYGTGQSFRGRHTNHAYHDTLSGAAYLEFMRERLILLRELLAENGSIYVHLDNAMAAAVKIIMDEVFGPKNFRNWITRKKCNPKNYTSRQYGNMQDYLLFYSKGKNPIWNRPYEAERIYSLEQRFPRVDEVTGRRFALVPVHARGRRNGATGGSWRGLMPPEGKHWQYHPNKLDELDRLGDIYWSPTGNPRRKIWADESQGVPVQDIWLEYKDAHNQNIKITGYPTEKNLDLLKRIVETSSNPNDLVLDCFAGSGTTLLAAQELGRRWIGMDNAPLARLVTLERLLEQCSNHCISQQGLPLFSEEDSTSAPFVVLAPQMLEDSADDDGPDITSQIDRGVEVSISQSKGGTYPLGLMLFDFNYRSGHFAVGSSAILGREEEVRVILPLPPSGPANGDGSSMAALVFATDGTSWLKRIPV